MKATFQNKTEQNSKALHVVIRYGLKLSFVKNNFVFNEVVNILHLIFGLVVKAFAFGSIHGFLNKAIIMYLYLYNIYLFVHCKSKQQ